MKKNKILLLLLSLLVPCSAFSSPSVKNDSEQSSKEESKITAPQSVAPTIVVFPFELGGENEIEAIRYNNININSNAAQSRNSLANYAGILSKDINQTKGEKVIGVDKRYASKLSSILLNSRKFRAVSRDKESMKRVLNETKMNESEYVALAQDKLVGELVLANYVVIGNIYRKEMIDKSEYIAATNEMGSRFAGAMTVGYRVIDVRTGICVAEGEVKERMNSIDIRRDYSAKERRDWTAADYMDILYDRSANAVANQILQTIYAVKVAAVNDKVITLNRGFGSGIEPNQIFEVWKEEGTPVVDPDTGDLLSNGDVLIGKIQIISIQPRYSVGKVIELFPNESISVGSKCTPIKVKPQEETPSYPVRKPNW